MIRRIALLEHLLECQITGPGSSSGQEAAVAASGSAAGTLHEQDQKRFIVQERCSAQKRYRSVAGAGSEALQRPGPDEHLHDGLLDLLIASGSPNSARDALEMCYAWPGGGLYCTRTVLNEDV